MTVGERIRTRREEMGLTQDDLARLVGYRSRSSINKIELSRELPLRKIQAVARALDVSPVFLMGWDEKDAKTAMDEIDTSEVSLRLRDDKDMVQALKVYFKMPPEKKKHVVETIHLIGDKK